MGFLGLRLSSQDLGFKLGSGFKVPIKECRVWLESQVVKQMGKLFTSSIPTLKPLLQCFREDWGREHYRLWCDNGVGHCRDALLLGAARIFCG